MLKGLIGRFDAIFNRFSLVLDSQKQIGSFFLLSILFLTLLFFYVWTENFMFARFFLYNFLFLGELQNCE